MSQSTIKGPVQITIAGPQGSGKTVFIKLLQRVIAAEGLSGTVVITEQQTIKMKREPQ